MMSKEMSRSTTIDQTVSLRKLPQHNVIDLTSSNTITCTYYSHTTHTLYVGYGNGDVCAQKFNAHTQSMESNILCYQHTSALQSILFIDAANTAVDMYIHTLTHVSLLITSSADCNVCVHQVSHIDNSITTQLIQTLTAPNMIINATYIQQYIILLNSIGFISVYHNSALVQHRHHSLLQPFFTLVQSITICTAPVHRLTQSNKQSQDRLIKNDYATSITRHIRGDVSSLLVGTSEGKLLFYTCALSTNKFNYKQQDNQIFTMKHTYKLHNLSVTYMNVLINENMLLSCSHDCTFKIHDLTSLNCYMSISTVSKNTVFVDAQYSINNNQVYICSDHSLYIYNTLDNKLLREQQCVRRLQQPSIRIVCVRLLVNDSILMLVFSNNDVALYAINRNVDRYVYAAHNNEITSICTTNTQQLISTSYSNVINVYSSSVPNTATNVQAIQLFHTIKLKQSAEITCCCNVGDSCVLVGCADGSIQLYDTNQQSVSITLAPISDAAVQTVKCAYQPHNHTTIMFYLLFDSNVVNKIDITSILLYRCASDNIIINSIAKSSTAIADIELCPYSTTIYIANIDCTITAHNYNTSHTTPITSNSLTDKRVSINYMCIHGIILFAANTEGNITMYNTINHSIINSINGSAPVNGISVLHQFYGLIAYITSTGTLTIYDYINSSVVHSYTHSHTNDTTVQYKCLHYNVYNQQLYIGCDSGQLIVYKVSDFMHAYTQRSDIDSLSHSIIQMDNKIKNICQQQTRVDELKCHHNTMMTV